MERGTKVTVTLSEKMLEMLDKLVELKGVKRTVIVALALEKFYRDEMRDSDGK